MKKAMLAIAIMACLSIYSSASAQMCPFGESEESWSCYGAFAGTFAEYKQQWLQHMCPVDDATIRDSYEIANQRYKDEAGVAVQQTVTTSNDITDAQLAAMGITREQYNKSVSVQSVTTSMSNENPVCAATVNTFAGGTSVSSSLPATTAVSGSVTSGMCPFADQTSGFNPAVPGNMSLEEYTQAYKAMFPCCSDNSWIRDNYNSAKASQNAAAQANGHENQAELDARMATATAAVVNLRKQGASSGVIDPISLFSKNNFRSNLTPVYASRFSGTLYGARTISGRFAGMGSSFLGKSGLQGINTGIFSRAASSATSRFGKYTY